MLDRYDAVEAMKQSDLNVKRDFLVQLYQKEKSIQVKNEIINQLINDKDTKSLNLIKQAIAEGEIKIQKNIVDITKTIPAELIPDYEKLLNGNSYDMIVAVLEKLCEQNPSKTKVYLELTKNTDGCTGKNVKIKRLEIA